MLQPIAVSGLWLMAKLFYIGGYSSQIHLAALDDQGNLHKIASYPSGTNPSILALHPNLPILYAANEIENGSVQAFTYDRSGKLSPFGDPISTRGSSPAFISTDPSGRWLLFANYGGGSYGVAELDPSGKLVAPEPISFVQVEKSVRPPGNPSRQAGPHPHQIITDSSGQFVFVCDLGNDEIHFRRLHRDGRLSSRRFESLKVSTGSGPRHMVFSSDNRFAYVVNELSNSVDLYAYESDRGKLTSLNKTWSTLDSSLEGTMTAAEIALSPDGRFLYASNRGAEQDTIAVFGVDCGSGELELKGLDEVGGSGPRHFSIDPSGEMVIVGLENSNKVSVLRRSLTTGRLSLVSTLEGVVHPTYIQFIKMF